MLKKLFTFNSRAKRKEFWKIQVLIAISYIIPGVLIFILSSNTLSEDILSTISSIKIITTILIIPFIIINLAVTIRRLHDINLSGWYFLIIILLGAIDNSGIASLAVIILLGSIPSTFKDTEWDEEYS